MFKWSLHLVHQIELAGGRLIEILIKNYTGKNWNKWCNNYNEYYFLFNQLKRVKCCHLKFYLKNKDFFFHFVVLIDIYIYNTYHLEHSPYINVTNAKLCFNRLFTKIFFSLIMLRNLCPHDQTTKKFYMLGGKSRRFKCKKSTKQKKRII